MRTLIVNFKNYPEIMGEGSVRLALALGRAAEAARIEAIAAPPVPMISLVASRARVQVYSQTVGSEEGDRSTGAVVPEVVKAAGAAGTILNHSESRRTFAELRRLVPRLLGLGMGVCLCARTPAVAARLSTLGSTHLAVEPPGLIGTGVAVSKARPELVSGTVSAARKAGYEGKILCGAGIVSGTDVARAVELGADGVLVASSVVKAGDWGAKVRELANSLN